MLNWHYKSIRYRPSHDSNLQEAQTFFLLKYIYIYTIHACNHVHTSSTTSTTTHTTGKGYYTNPLPYYCYYFHHHRPHNLKQAGPHICIYSYVYSTSRGWQLSWHQEYRLGSYPGSRMKTRSWAITRYRSGCNMYCWMIDFVEKTCIIDRYFPIDMNNYEGSTNRY